jgi:hypothetical protein
LKKLHGVSGFNTRPSQRWRVKLMKYYAVMEFSGELTDAEKASVEKRLPFGELITPGELIRSLIDDEMVEVARKAIEDELVEMRDDRISMPLCGNGFVIKEKNGERSDLIRLRTDVGFRLGIRAIIKKLS